MLLNYSYIICAGAQKADVKLCKSAGAISSPLCVCVHLSPPPPPSTSPRQLQSAKKNKQLSLPTLRSGIILIAVSAMESGKKHVPAAAAEQCTIESSKLIN
jgi:hypothetical protein